MGQQENFIPKTIVIGHKNPDTDSMVSAVAYAAFKKQTGLSNVIAGRAGFPNARTEYLFNKFEVKLPELIQDVIPEIGDIMNHNSIHIKKEQSLLDAVEIFQKYHQDRIPVVDDNNNYLGMISLFDISNKLFALPGSSSSAIVEVLDRKVTTSIRLAAKTLNAEILNMYDECDMEDLYVYVAAQSLSGFRKHILEHSPENLAIVVGDRDDILFMSVELGVRLLIITGNSHISDGIISMATEKKTTILRTKFDSASSVRRLKFSTPVAYMLQSKTNTYFYKDKFTDARHNILSSHEDIFPVLDQNNKLLGTVSKTDMDDIHRVQLILVDHNNLNQAVDGASEVPIIEILDHHHLNYPTTASPITVQNDIVGSTCTLVSEKYKYMGIEPEKKIAGLLMGAIIDDTLYLKSPTSTNRDKEAIVWLEKICGISAEQLAGEIFNIGSIIACNPPEIALTSDKKNYNAGKYIYSIAQVEEVNFGNFNSKFDKLLKTANEIVEKEKLSFFGLIVTNLPKETSLLLATGSPKFMELLPYTKIKANLYDLPGIMSRKKQLIPQLVKVFQPVGKE